MKIGEALNFGNTSELITVKFADGTYTIAVAGNTINSTKVLVAGDRVWSETSPEDLLEIVDVRRMEDFFEEEEEEQTFLPFQVLFLANDGLGIGGDRAQIFLTTYLAVLTGGINNLGLQSFLSVWEQEDCQVLQNKDLAPTINILNSNFCPLPFSYWVGSGILTTAIQREEIPNVTPIIVETGQPLPFWLDIPPYPIFYLPDNNRLGTRTETKVSENGNYSFNQSEDWDYTQTSVGGSPNQDPLTAILPLCDFITSGTSYAAEFNRYSSFDYNKSITESFVGDVRVWWNNQPYLTSRQQNYTETLTLEQTVSLFSSTTYYSCQTITPPLPGFPQTGFYQWVGGSTFANFTGETTTTTRTYAKTIAEQLDRPLTRLETGINLVNLNENYQETRILTFPSQNWTLPQGVYHYDFEVPGQEVKTVNHSTLSQEETLEPLLLSGAGVEALLLRSLDSNDSVIVENRTSNISRILRDNTTSALVPTIWTITETVASRDSLELYYFDGSDRFNIDLDSSFYVMVDNPTFAPELGSYTLYRDNGDPLLSSSRDRLTGYRKEEDKIANSIDYYDVEKVPISFWANLEGMLIFLLADNYLYRGIITGVDYQDDPHPDLEIDIIRTLNSVSMDLHSLIDYPMSEPSNYELYSQDNISGRVFSLLTSGDRNYCNLVGNIIYYAKNVSTRLEESTQLTEVFQIAGNEIIQLELEQGPFIPVTSSNQVLGISYYPN